MARTWFGEDFLKYLTKIYESIIIKINLTVLFFAETCRQGPFGQTSILFIRDRLQINIFVATDNKRGFEKYFCR